jgi:hypothetical protein
LAFSRNFARVIFHFNGSNYSINSAGMQHRLTQIGAGVGIGIGVEKEVTKIDPDTDSDPSPDDWESSLKDCLTWDKS